MSNIREAAAAYALIAVAPRADLTDKRPDGRSGGLGDDKKESRDRSLPTRPDSGEQPASHY